MVEILRYIVVHDCGTVINPMIVEGQIHGGVAAGIGNAFYEELVFDEYGGTSNASFMDYLLPTATDVPPIETAHLETPVPAQPARHEGRGGGGSDSGGGGVRAGGRRRAGRHRPPGSRSSTSR